MYLTTIKNWHISRWIVLLAGLFFGWQSIYYWDAVPALLALFLLYQVITGNGCLVYGSCTADVKHDEVQKTTDRNPKNIEYTTIEEN